MKKYILIHVWLIFAQMYGAVSLPSHYHTLYAQYAFWPLGGSIAVFGQVLRRKSKRRWSAFLTHESNVSVRRKTAGPSFLKEKKKSLMLCVSLQFSFCELWTIAIFTYCFYGIFFFSLYYSPHAFLRWVTASESAISLFFWKPLELCCYL